MTRNILIIVCLLTLVSASSCNKWLDLQPQDGITRQEFWKTREQVQAALTGCYAALLGNPAGITDQTLADYLFMWGELRADMVAPGNGIAADELDLMTANILPTNSLVSWRNAYRIINYCNTVIDFAPQVMQYDQTLKQAELDAYLAEALALRSLLYFYLVRSFGDVPLKLKSTSSDAQLEQLPKSGQQQVLEQIITDLATAEKNAVTTFGNKNTDKGRITRYTINALQADVYLWMEKYAECLAACDKIINAGKFELVPGNGSWFTTLYYIGNSNESIFELQFDAQKLNTFYGMFATSRKRYVAAPRVMDEVYTIDFTDEENKDLRGEAAAVRSSDGSIWKYIGFDYNSMRAQDASYAHWIVYRLAEVLLMKAEALAQLNRGAAALELVVFIRDRAHALATTEKQPDPADVDAVADYILEERTREFAYEGKRWYDVLRNAKRRNYARIDLLLDMVAKSAPPERQQSIINKYKDYNSHYFPIHFYELQTDKNLAQNPFYQ